MFIHFNYLRVYKIKYAEVDKIQWNIFENRLQNTVFPLEPIQFSTDTNNNNNNNVL